MSKNNKITFGARLGYRLMYGACWLVGLLPWWFLYYVLADTIYFIVYKVGRYRVKVVRSNLASSFPEKSIEELRAIERAYYHNLSEYFVDAVDLASITERQLLKRCVWPEENRAEVIRTNDGRDWIALLGHFGSWELMSTYGFYRDSSDMVSAFRPVNNKSLDLYYRKVRNRPPFINSVPSNDIIRYYMAHRGAKGADGQSLSIILIADQNPSLDAQSWWVEFLHHPTVFFHGGEKIARKFGLPVYFMHVRKVKRGHWEQTFELIWDGTSPVADREITDTYARLLEEAIRRTPELWLWSHRRWKRMPKGEDARKYNEAHGTDIPE